jgi:hypothetical protein
MAVSSSPGSGIDATGWNSFLAQPALYADPSRLALCFDGQLAADLCARLQTVSRLEPRLSDRLRSHYGLAEGVAVETMDETDRAIAMTPAAQLVDLARHCGAIYWGNTIAAAILAPQVVVIDAALGATLASYALAHRDLSGPVQPFDLPDGLAARVLDDGWRCLAAWCDAQPDGVGTRVRLKLPPSGALDRPPVSPLDQLGGAIVRRAAIR